MVLQFLGHFAIIELHKTLHLLMELTRQTNWVILHLLRIFAIMKLASSTGMKLLCYLASLHFYGRLSAIFQFLEISFNGE